jgi:hypothetical protein
MPLANQTSAEHIMGAVEAIVVNGQPTTLAMVADFLETTQGNATAALEMATDLGLVSMAGANYVATSPLCRYVASAIQKAAVLRILLESYRPFTMFRERLKETADLDKAAQSTKNFCALPASRDTVKETLLNLGSYSGALVPKGAGRYQVDAASLVNALKTIASSCVDMVQAEARVRDQLGPEAAGIIDRDSVLLPLADALFRANQRDPDGAVQQAGNAVESHIVALAGRMAVNVAGAHGIVQKLSRFGGNPRRLPTKLTHIGEYLGAIRNAADHGPDADIGNQAWTIRDSTGLEYVFVACSFIAATINFERGHPAEI